MSRNVAKRFAATPLLLLAAICLGPSARGTEPALHPIASPHYLIQTDIPDELARDLSMRMEAMYDEYSRRLADFKADKEMPRLQVYLFAKQTDYLRFTGDRLKNTGGIYIPKRNLLAAFLEGQGRDGLRRTLQHEAFHQFAYNCISRSLPVWLNEGLAQLFEEGVWTGDGFLLGQRDPGGIRQLQSDLKGQRIVDFQTFLRMSPEQWAANLTGEGGQDVGATQYNQSWAMVYFLVHAKDEKDLKTEKYRPRLINMMLLMHEGKDAETAFREAFSDNIRGFQARFMAYSRTLQSTEAAAMMDRQGVLGDLLAELNRRGKKFTSVTQFKRAALAGGYRMHYTKGELQWDSDPDLRVYFADVNGRVLATDQLYFEPRDGAPLPDLVCRYSPMYQLRTRFFPSAEKSDKIEHEVLLEMSEGGRAKAD